MNGYCIWGVRCSDYGFEVATTLKYRPNERANVINAVGSTTDDIKKRHGK